MIELKGKYNKARVYTRNICDKTSIQITDLCNRIEYKDNHIAIMPDCLVGAGCVIGTSMTIKDRVAPNLVGYDIGCGLISVKIKNKQIDFNELDRVIRTHIPFGRNVRNNNHKNANRVSVENLVCLKQISYNRVLSSIGTLGGGNHFIEINEDKLGNYYLTVHSGSRCLGREVATFYQDLAYKMINDDYNEYRKIISELEEEHDSREIKRILKNRAYLYGKDFYDYIDDMMIVQEYADINRTTIIEEITKRMGFEIIDSIVSVHNYIDNNMVLRKGAISANKNEKVLIPINMRDGLIIGEGKGNRQWNNSAPHGAGRILSRSEAREKLNLVDYENEMSEVWSSCIRKNTLDESPGAYKSIDNIIDNTEDTIKIIDIMKPVYNFKA